ncbi:MAG TPA: transposase [Streptosporangiaceae bacterium]
MRADPGGVSRRITAGQAERILGPLAPPDAVAAARIELAAAYAGDLRRIDDQLRGARKRLDAAVRASGTSLTGLFGVGPVVAAVVIGEVRDVTRFPGRDCFAACNGTAPIEVSSGRRQACRLSRRGNRRLNHAVHMAAVTQVSHRHSEGRACYDKKIAEGKTPKEALRSLKRRVSDAVFTRLRADARRAAAAEEDPGGQTGNGSVPGAAGSHPARRLFGKATPGSPAQPAAAAVGTEPAGTPAFPRQLPIPRRRRSPGSRWSARSEARTNDLDARQNDGHTRPRGRPRRNSARPLDAKRLRSARLSAGRLRPLRRLIFGCSERGVSGRAGRIFR